MPLPVMLNLNDQPVLIVGGGRVAHRRAELLLQHGATITVVAPSIDEAIAALPVQTHQREYVTTDLDRQFLVIAATNHPEINQRISEEANQRGILCSRADSTNSTESDITFMAHHQWTDENNPQAPLLTLALTTHGQSATAATQLRDELKAQIDPNWLTFLKCVGEARRGIQAEMPASEQRTQRIQRLANRDAQAIYFAQGEAAWRQYVDGES